MSTLVFILLATTAGFGQESAYPIPDGPQPIVEALSPFRENPDSSRVARLLEAQRAAGFPSEDRHRVLASRLWRRAGEPELALSALENVPAESEAFDLATYEGARAMLESDRQAAGAAGYWKACSTQDETVREEVRWDLLPVMTPQEREAWTNVEPGEPTCGWLRSFWGERAQRMAIPRDQRLALHFQRLARAQDEMWLSRPRFYREVTDEHGRPPGLAIDDRGLMLVRLGEPDQREVCPGVEGDSLAECWAYYRPGGYRLFRFSMYKKARGDIVPDGDYTLDEGVPYRAAGDAWNHKYVLNADIPATAKRGLQRIWRASHTTQEDLEESERMLDESERMMDAAEFGGTTGRALVLATRRYADEALQRIPDVPDIESTLSMRFEALRFLNPSTTLWQVWLLASVRAGDLSVDDARGSLDIGGRISTLQEGAVADVRLVELPERSVSADVPEQAGIEVRGALTASPGVWPVTFVVEDLNTPGSGAWIQDTVNVPAIGGLPQLSDIAVAQAEGGTWTRDGRTFLQVSPAHITNPDGSIHTYFEVYGVRRGTRYDVEFRLAPVDAAERIWRLEPDDLGFRLQFTSEMPGEIGRHHLRLDLDDTEPGEYVLAVRIQDEDTKAYSLPSVTDVFVARR